MSTKAGESYDAKIRQELDRIQSLTLAIQYVKTSLNTEIIRAYAEEIALHCDNIDRIREEAADHYT